MEGARQWDVFLSYATPELALAETITQELTKSGLHTFLAPRTIAPGQSFPDELMIALETSRAMLCILSASSLNSPWVKRETVGAAALDMPIIACSIDDTPLPQGMEFVLKLTQRFPISNPPTESDVERIVKAVGGEHDRVEAHLAAYARNVQNWHRIAEVRSHLVPLKVRREGRTDSLEALVERTPRVVVTGSPGAGKSTFLLRMLDVSCERLEQALDAKSGATRSDLVLPVYLEFGWIADSTPHAVRDHLCAHIIERLALQSTGTPRAIFDQLVSRFPVTLLLDGLNELTRAHQETCAQALFSLEHDLAAKGIQNRLRVVLTSRSYSFVDYFEPQGYASVEIVPLTPDDIRAELTRRLELRGGSEKLYLDLNVRFRQFLANPQHLTYVLDCLEDQGRPGRGAQELVRSRGRLLEYCIERRIRLPDRDKDFARTVLQAVGYRTSSAGTFFSIRDVLTTAEQAARDHGLVGREQELLEELLKVGILVRHKELCRFGHHSIQQYFAAAEMKQRWRLDEYFATESLHECLVIMAGLLDPGALENLLRQARPNPRLFAYILANVDAPEHEQAFIDDTVGSFTRRMRRSVLSLGRVMNLTLAVWFLFLPVPALYIMAGLPGITSRPLMWLVTFAASAYSVGPGIALVLGVRESRRMHARLKEVDLPNLLASMRYLMADGALKLVRKEAKELYASLPFAASEPRRSFVNTVLATIDTTASISTYLTEDEVLNQIGDPLVAALVDPASISPSGLSKLLSQSESQVDRIAVQSVTILRQLFLLHEDQREAIGRRLMQMARTGSVLSKPRRAALKACRALNLNIDEHAPSLLRWLFELLGQLLRRRDA